MTESDIKLGDTVRLKSSGHLMTIVGLTATDVECAWSVKGDNKSKSFPLAAVEKHDGAPTKITVSFVGGLPDEEVFTLIRGLRDALSQADTSATELNRRLVQAASDFLVKHEPSSQELPSR